MKKQLEKMNADIKTKSKQLKDLKKESVALSKKLNKIQSQISKLYDAQREWCTCDKCGKIFWPKYNCIGTVMVSDERPVCVYEGSDLDRPEYETKKVHDYYYKCPFCEDGKAKTPRWSTRVD